MPTTGLDEAWDRPAPADLVAAGLRFVIGYLSNDPTKNLTAARVAELAAAGIGVGAVWETTTSAWQGGEAQGMADGQAALAQAQALGWPDGAAIYFALDEDIPGGSPAALAYLQAAASQIAPHPAGVYGCGDILLQAVGHVVAAGWLSGSTGWSGYQAARTSPVTGILQTTSTTIGGASVDLDVLLVPDDEVGLWWPAPTPPQPVPAPQILSTTPDPEVDNMQQVLITIPTDANGDGWTPSPVTLPDGTIPPFTRFISVTVNPANEQLGQASTPGTAKAASAWGGIYVELEGCTPHTPVGATLVLAGP